MTDLRCKKCGLALATIVEHQGRQSVHLYEADGLSAHVYEAEFRCQNCNGVTEFKGARAVSLEGLP